jgi:hypothetical protein
MRIAENIIDKQILMFQNLLYDVLWHGSSRCRAG